MVSINTHDRIKARKWELKTFKIPFHAFEDRHLTLGVSKVTRLDLWMGDADGSHKYDDIKRCVLVIPKLTGSSWLHFS